MKYVYVRNGKLYYKFRLNGKLFRKSTGLTECKSNEIVALKMCLRHRDEILSGAFIDSKKDSEDMKISEALEYTIDNNDFGFKHKRLYGQVIRKFMKICGDIKLSQLSEFHNRRFKNYMLENFEHSTARTYLRYMKCLINFLIKKKIFRRDNVFENLKDKNRHRAKRIIPEEHLNLILNYFKDTGRKQFYFFVKLLSITGLRKGEALNLKWEDIDFQNKIISINNTKGDRYDDIYFTKDIRIFFKEYDGKKDGNIFTWECRNSSRMWNNALNKLKLPHYAIHDIRRTFGSKYANILTSSQLKEVMRHRSINTTYNYYIQIDRRKIAEMM